MTPSVFIDLKALKSQIRIRDVLERIGVLDKFRDKGNGQLVGPCPLHAGDNQAVFSVNQDKGIFRCFSCKAHGNALELVMQAKNLDVRAAAVLATEWFAITTTKPRAGSAHHARVDTKQTVEETAPQEPESEIDKSAASKPRDSKPNPRLDLVLKLDPEHPYLRQERCFTEETIKAFGVGYCARGLLKNRIAVPLHDEDGVLVAYAGRATSETQAEAEGKWKFPKNFKASAVVFNLFRVRQQSSHAVVVEGIFDVLRLHQNGFPNAVALLGSSLSEYQEQLLAESFTHLTLMFDGDDAGRKCCSDCLLRLSQRLFVKLVNLADGIDPDTAEKGKLQALLS